MEKAASALETSSSSLTKSLSQLASSDRADGWQTLSDACKVIAEKTTKLLQIVYGAEVERLISAAEKALESLDEAKLSVAVSAKSPQFFANSASNAATKAGISSDSRHLTPKYRASRSVREAESRRRGI
jgi:hypothetical protein